MLKTFIISLFFVFSFDVIAAEKPALKSESGLPIPRFATIRSDETNVRSGPGKQYPIKWVLVKKEMPIEILAEYETWRKIRDIQGDEGWVQKSMLIGQRMAIINSAQAKLYKSEKETSDVKAVLDKGVVLKLKKCYHVLCSAEVQDIEGFISKKDIWGVYPDESFEK